MKASQRKVVITGTGVLAPLGLSVESVFEALVAGRSVTTADAGFDTTGYDSRVVGRLPADADLSTGMRKDQVRYFRKNAKVMCRDIQIAVGSVGPAVAQAGLALGNPPSDAVLPTIDHTRFGVLYGAGFIPVELSEMGATVAISLDGDGRIDMKKWGQQGIPLMFPLWLLKYLPNMLACHVGIIWDCQGPSNSITCNDASGLLAIGEATRHIARSTADIMIAGAAESRVHPSHLIRHYLQKAATTRHNDRPESAHRPFDTDRDGSVCSEATAALILESADHASARGGKPLAIIAGFGSSCATTLPTVPEASGRGIALAVRAALRDAGIEPGDVDAVVARGTAIPGQDLGEARAIRETLGDVPVTCFAGGMGNTGAAQAVVDTALATMMIGRGVIPSIRNCDNLDPACPINAVRGEAINKELNTVVVLSASVSAQTAALVLRKA